MDWAEIDRRDVLRMLGGASLAALDWSAFPRRARAAGPGDDFDVVIVGSGLGGLSCAAAFARQGFRPLVIEQRDRAGGYASSVRVGDFEFDLSLHSTTISHQPDGSGVVPGFPELDVEFVPHPDLCRAIFPKHDVRVPQRDVAGYRELLCGLFPDQAGGLEALFRDMQRLTDDADRFLSTPERPDFGRVPAEFPHMFRHHQQTWDRMMGARVDDPELQAVLSAHWGYFGLPPSELSALYYAIPVMGYLRTGGYYPRGRSQGLSDAFVRYIEARGGKVLLATKVVAITTEGGAATGVQIEDGSSFRVRAVVSNADPRTTFEGLLDGGAALARYRERLAAHRVSLSGFQVYLGLKRDLLHETGVRDSEVFLEATYDLDLDYARCRRADVEGCQLTATLFDNIHEGYSPPGRNTLNILALQGYEPWSRFEEELRAGERTAYEAEKARMAEVVVRRLEDALLPGLSDAVEVQQVATPLTFARDTGSSRGALYGFDQVLGNSGPTRLPHQTPIANLYLAGAWTTPGHGYAGVIMSGLECFGEIVRSW